MTDKLTHHELTAEWVDDRQGRAIMLTQPADNYDEPGSVLLHPWQLRAVCEQFGIIASDQQAAKTIATLTRRLLVLRDRIDELAADLSNNSDHKHADLSYEMTYANATADIAAEFCAELEGVQPCTVAPEQAPERVKPSTSIDPRQLSIDACN
jgi:hypothetical protein